MVYCLFEESLIPLLIPEYLENSGIKGPLNPVTDSATNTGESGQTKDVTFTEVPPTPMTGTTKILANGNSFGADAGFPKIGFTGATFQFAIDGDVANNSNYTRTVKSGSWLSVGRSDGG